MFTVYKITNKINNKSYIGSSIRVQQRWQQHKNTAFNKNSSQYKYPLYQAFRKYGIKNFIFEIIKDDFETFEEMRLYEQQMIIYYNSLKNGYNQTINTFGFRQKNKKIGQKCAKIDSKNNILKIYNSYHEAARDNNLDENNGDYAATLVRQICKGYLYSINNLLFRDLNENNEIIKIKNKTCPRRQKIFCINVNTLEEKVFNSISEASKELNIDRNRIQLCSTGSSRYSIIHNYIFRKIDNDGNIVENLNCSTIEEKLQEYNNLNPEINGERHSIKDWCNIYNISTVAYYKRINKGMSVIEAITTPKRR